jgi:hypothetical protein
MKKNYLFFVIILSVFAYGCGSSKKALTPMKIFSGNLNGWKPEGVDAKNGILLVEKIKSHKDKQHKRIAAYMAKHYPYKYEFFDGDSQLDYGKYKDTGIYKFVLASNFRVKTAQAPNTNYTQMERSTGVREVGSHQLSVASYDFYFIDRQSGKTYPKTGISSSNALITFKEIIKIILKQ